ncbi:MAG: hypothetical protein KBD01_07355 [Acidobacteria bacterium]|nr:hypothetical protein [Acidobacteriota bacterium]
MESWLAALPPGAAVPSTGWLIAAVVFVVVTVALNAIWERWKGPPNP